jgi:hypothetical protein
MGIPDGAHTHGSGGGLGTAVLVLVGAALAVKLAGPVVAAAAALLHILLIAVVVILGLAGAGLAGLLAFRVRRRLDSAARTVSPRASLRCGPPSPLPPPRPEIEAPRRAPGPPGELHLHFHGVSAEDVAAILAHQDRPRPEVDRPGPPHVP